MATTPTIPRAGSPFHAGVSPDGDTIVGRRQSHRSIIEVEPPQGDDPNVPVAGIHTHVLDDVPEDTDVFHVLARRPAVPEMVVTQRFVFQVEPDGNIKYVGKADEVLNKGQR